MSVKELNFYHPQTDAVLIIKQVDIRTMFNIKQGLVVDVDFPLDRNQAHLLYLYLKEHLEVDKDFGRPIKGKYS